MNMRCFLSVKGICSSSKVFYSYYVTQANETKNIQIFSSSIILMRFFLLFTLFVIITMMSSSSRNFFATACELPSCCNMTMRNTKGANGFPMCIIVGIIKDQGDDARYFTRDLPFSVWNATVRGVPGLSDTPIFYKQTDNTYDSGLEGLRQNDYDAYIGDLWALSRRSAGIDFSIGYTREFMGLVFIVEEKPAIPFLNFFAPFQGIIWGLSVCLLVFGGILLFIVEWWHPVSDDVPPRDGRLVYRFAFWRSVLRSFDNSFMSPFGAGRFAPKSPAGAFVIFGLKFFFLILIESFVAQLASSLTISGASGQVTLDDLLKKGILSQSNANVDFAQASGGKVITTTESPTPELLLEYTNGPNEKNVLSYVMGSGVLLNSIDRFCNARYIPLPFSVDTSLSFRQHATVASVRRAVDFMTLTLRQNGTMLSLLEKTYMEESLRCTDSRFPATERVEDPETLQLGVENLRGLFIVTIALMAFGVVAAGILRVITEFLYGSYSAKTAWSNAKYFMQEISEAPSGVEWKKSPDTWKSDRIKQRENQVK